jgi:putative tricarboxylic transport membrane protein
MDAMSGLVMGFGVIMTPENLYWCLIGSILGTLLGVLPGIGPLVALSVLLPVTFGMPPVAAIAMLAAIFYGASYGGSISSILVNIPGDASSVVTAIEGNQMALNGRAGVALGMSAICSFIASTVTLIFLSFLSPVLAEFAVRMGPPEYAALVVLGLICTLMMIRGSILKGLIMLSFGAFVASVGIDVVTGTQRFAYGSINLISGFNLIAIVIGLFGVSEILMNIEQIFQNKLVKTKLRDLWPTKKDWKDSAMPIARGTGLGFGLGLIPGGGPITASFMSYAIEKRAAERKGHKFGTGRIEGVAGPESANNAAVSGGMIPLLSLGIPGNPVTAILLGALVIQGVQPGPMMIQQYPDVFWGVIASMYVGNVFLLLLNLPLVGLWVQLLRIPYVALFPTILLLAIVGSYAANKNIYDVWVMLGFGVLGYGLRKLEYDLAPLILAVVLGPLLEESLRQSMVMSPDGLMIFAHRPMSVTLLSLAVLVIGFSLYSRFNRRRPKCTTI